MDYPTNNELLWKQYSMWVDLYKFYVDITIKINIFYYAITGAMLSFYFSRIDHSLIKYSLLLPIAMSLALAGLSITGIKLLEISRSEVFSIRDKLGLGSAPEFRILSYILGTFGGLFVFVAFALGYLVLYG